MRPRSLTAGLAKSEMVWLGPEKPEGIQKEFLQIFGASVQTTGEIYFAEDAATCLLQQRDMIVKRGRTPSRYCDVLGDPFENLRRSTNAGSAQRLDAYLERRAEFEGVGGAFLMDIQQWPGVRYGQGGPFWPTMLMHGDIVSANNVRVATGKEHFFAQGYNVFNTWGKRGRLLLRHGRLHRFAFGCKVKEVRW